MSKHWQSAVVATSQSLEQLKDRINKYLKQNKNKSLFDKLQYYDHVVGQLKIPRSEDAVLKIFKQLIEESARDEYLPTDRQIDEQGHRYMGKNKQHSVHVFSSPANHKKQSSIEDPELFSFSKTRKQSHNKSNSHNEVTLSVLNKRNLQKINKIKQNSDKPRYTAPVLTEPNERRVSQFNGEGLEDHNHQYDAPNNQTKSVYDLAKIWKNQTIAKNFKIFCQLVRVDIKQRKKNFKLKTSGYIYQVKLMKKTFQAFKAYHSQMNARVEQFRGGKMLEQVGQIFEQWYRFATRSQQERYRQKQVKMKRLLLTQKLGIRQFIRNSYVPAYFQQQYDLDDKLFLHSYRKQITEQNQKKSELLMKFLAVSTLSQSYYYGQELVENKKQLRQNRRMKFFRTMAKLMKCLIEANRLKYEKLIDKTERKVGATRFINSLKKQYFFQKAYWASPAPKQFGLGLEVLEAQKQLPFLNPQYQKIVLLYQLFDCAHHSLSRKGYKFLDKFEETIGFTAQIHQHPAYQNYYRPKKVHKYFMAMKSVLLTQTKEKADLIKYNIVGKRVIRDGLLIWYKRKLQMQVMDGKIEEKYEELELLYGDKWKKQFLCFLEKDSKHDQRKEMLENRIRNGRVIESVMILKTYMISKNYYRKVILQSKLKKKLRILQSYFLEWKLHCAENVHNRLLEDDLIQIRRKFTIRAIKQNIDMYSLQDRLHNKKCQNLQKCLLAERGQSFLELLRRQWQVRKQKEKVSKIQHENKCQLVTQLVEMGKKQKFMTEVIQFWYQSRLSKEIILRVSNQYDRKMLAKSMLGLKAMLRVNKEEKRRFEIIRRRKQVSTKSKVLSTFIEKMIKKLILKRLGFVAKKYWFTKLVQQISQWKLEESQERGEQDQDIIDEN